MFSLWWSCIINALVIFLCLCLCTVRDKVQASSMFLNKKQLSILYLPVKNFLTLLSILRLLYYTKSGQYLATSIEECAESLRDVQITRSEDVNFNYIKSLKQDMKDLQMCLISSVFDICCHVMTPDRICHRPPPSSIATWIFLFLQVRVLQWQPAAELQLCRVQPQPRQQ